MKCVVCGKEIERSCYGSAVLCSDKCYHINYWNETLDESAIIIDGECYHDGGRKPKGYRGFLGFGGREMKIKMNNGTIIDTNNLWCNGKVPEGTADNAQFIK